MADRPILFSGPMVRSILSGTKSQTRRIIKPQPQKLAGHSEVAEFYQVGTERKTGRLDFIARDQNHCPTYCFTPNPNELDCHLLLRWAPCDRLWVRETWRLSGARDDARPSDVPAGDAVEYPASPERILTGRARSARYMPRWASRITLEVTAVRVERVQDISCNDCYEEGVPRPTGPELGSVVTKRDNARGEYREIWQAINGVGSWEANPWVAVIEFRKVKVGAAIEGSVTDA